MRTELTLVADDPAGLVSVVYRHTILAQLDLRSRTVRLGSGGGRRNATLSRINRALSVWGFLQRVKRGTSGWLVTSPGRNPVPFVEGMSCSHS